MFCAVELRRAKHDDAFWSRRFASDPGIIGTSLTVEGQPYTVIGG
jgi:hypothetical protein